MKKLTTKKGFTLIELLVVIAIIGVLSSIILASVSSARKKADNAAILAESRQAQLAVSLYFDNTNALPGNSTVATRYCISGSCLFSGAAVSTSIDSVAPGYSTLFKGSSKIYPTVTIGGGTYRGIQYRCITFDVAKNKCVTSVIIYPVFGGTAGCKLGLPVLTDSNSLGTLCSANPLESNFAQSY